jgi:hypothetical protein
MMNKTELTRADTLIITVGTRQIGWRCQDGIIRSFGADGNIGYPCHVDELYQLLNIQRGKHEENGKTYPWSAGDLGKRFYDRCIDELGDFTNVELLLDYQIIDTGVKQGLKHIILWGTDQPETVSWFYRRLDTVWLAKLMEGKIKSIWKNVRVDIHAPNISANDNEAIKQELELLILREVLNSFSPTSNHQFVLWIQNKGCVPAIASAVEICAAALVRQCDVFNASPNEPDTFFQLQSNGYTTACASQEFKLIPMGEYFWPLERLRVISAWERGDFTEVQIWLKPHQNRHKLLYKLADILGFTTNWQTDKFASRVADWLNSKDFAKVESEEYIKAKQEQARQIKASNKFPQAWEASFLIYLALYRENYTGAFMQFAQTLERILYIYATADDWVKKEMIIIPDHLQHLGNQYQPGFKDLIDAWCKLKGFNSDHKWYKLLHRIREKRNDIIHKAESVTLGSIRSIWSNGGLFTVKHSENPESLMMDVLKEVCDRRWQIPEKTLLQSLYEWGLNTLQAESATGN